MNAETKRHIDTARQILVGVVPNPASQVDQITNALIYKFMDDMDQEAIKTGGDPSFFVGNLENYAWTRLMDTRMGNQERMNLYSEALLKFSEAKQLPELFRNIFKSAFLPYRSPEVLSLFLKEINYFNYSHTEELGDAYEHLLSIMASQGDAGQFLTPRHIIEFIVNVVNPTKTDKVLDPACGTGGFLIKAYEHILKQHDGKDDPEKKEKPLTPDERKTLMNNFEGYDIDPGMVRITQVNTYLHQFKNPKVYQYDTLSSDERWNDKFDVILANPPFMSPKGGIKPHNKFSIQSSRSEVLFVDYIMSHLKPNGRAGIIVPEGIIFQSGTAYKQLRKSLVEDGLYAVVSLPSGVFHPYAGVKTSILFFDNSAAKQKSELLFVKVENDGLDLGTQRRPIDKNDLPQALEILKKWKIDKKIESKLAVYVEKTKIAANEDYNLSGDRYRITTDYTNAKWPMIELKELCEITTGRKDANEGNPNGEYPFFTCAKENTFINTFSFDTEALLIAGNGDVGAVTYYKGKFDAYQRTYVLSNFKNVNVRYLFQILNNSLKENMQLQKLGNTMPYIRLGMLQTFQIPLPPLELQEQLVAELDGYQKIIVGAKQIADNWKPKIDIDPKCERVILGDICDIKSGGTPKTDNKLYWDGGNIPWVGSTVCKDNFVNEANQFITESGLKNSSAKKFKPETTLIALVGATIGKTGFLTFETTTNQNIAGLYPLDLEKLIPEYLFYISRSLYSEFIKLGSGKFRMANLEFLQKLAIPLPSLEVQKQIVEKIEAERALVESAKKLIDIYDQKTKDVIAKLWEK